MVPMQREDYCLKTVSTFDKFADRYAEKYFNLDIYDSYLERFANQIEPRGASVFDLACGPGNISAYLARKRPDLKLVGVDLSEAMVEQARSRVPSAEFLVKDCRELSGLDRVFDASAFAFGLSYLADNDVKRFFASLNTTLSDTAVLYLSTITGESSWSGYESTSTGDQIYIVYRSVSDVMKMVEREGYKIDFKEVVASPANAPKSTKDLILIARREKNDPA